MTAKKSKEITSVIVLVAIPTVIIACFGGFALYLTSTKEYCGEYAREQSKTSDFPDRKVAEAYDQCLRDKGLSGF